MPPIFPSVYKRDETHASLHKFLSRSPSTFHYNAPSPCVTSPACYPLIYALTRKFQTYKASYTYTRTPRRGDGKVHPSSLQVPPNKMVLFNCWVVSCLFSLCSQRIQRERRINRKDKALSNGSYERTTLWMECRLMECKAFSYRLAHAWETSDVAIVRCASKWMPR